MSIPLQAVAVGEVVVVAVAAVGTAVADGAVVQHQEPVAGRQAAPDEDVVRPVAVDVSEVVVIAAIGSTVGERPVREAVVVGVNVEPVAGLPQHIHIAITVHVRQVVGCGPCPPVDLVVGDAIQVPIQVDGVSPAYHDGVAPHQPLRLAEPVPIGTSAVGDAVTVGVVVPGVTTRPNHRGAGAVAEVLGVTGTDAEGPVVLAIQITVTVELGTLPDAGVVHTVVVHVDEQVLIRVGGTGGRRGGNWSGTEGRSEADQLDAVVAPGEQRRLGPGEGVNEGVGRAARSRVFHRNPAGEVGCRPDLVAVAELVDAVVVALEGDEDVTGQGVDHGTDTGAVFPVGNGGLSRQVIAVPGTVVPDLVDPLVLSHQVDVERSGDGVDEASGRRDRVVHRGQTGEVDPRPGDGVTGHEQLHPPIRFREQDVVNPVDGVHERRRVGTRVERPAGEHAGEVVATPATGHTIPQQLSQVVVRPHEVELQIPGEGIVVARGIGVSVGVGQSGVAVGAGCGDAASGAVDGHEPHIPVFADEQGCFIPSRRIVEGVGGDAIAHVGHPGEGRQGHGTPGSTLAVTITGFGVDVAVATGEGDPVLSGAGIDVATDVRSAVDAIHRPLGRHVQGGVPPGGGVGSGGAGRAAGAGGGAGHCRLMQGIIGQFVAVGQVVVTSVSQIGQAGAPFRFVPAEGAVLEALHRGELAGRTAVVDDGVRLAGSPPRIVGGVLLARGVHLVTDRGTEHVRATVVTVELEEAVAQDVGLGLIDVGGVEGDGHPVVAGSPGTTVPVFDDEGGIGCIVAAVPVHVATGRFVLDQAECPQFVGLGGDGGVGVGGDIVVRRRVVGAIHLVSDVVVDETNAFDSNAAESLVVAGTVVVVHDLKVNVWSIGVTRSAELAENLTLVHFTTTDGEAVQMAVDRLVPVAVIDDDGITVTTVARMDASFATCGSQNIHNTLTKITDLLSGAVGVTLDVVVEVD